MLGNRKEKRLAKKLAERSGSQSYWELVKGAFRKDRRAVWSLRVLFFLLFFALFADFLANEKPLYCKIDGQTHFPVMESYLVGVGLKKWDPVFLTGNWHNLPYEKVVYPPIPYDGKSIDFLNSGYQSPFDKQNVTSNRFWHWLGTDELGHDVAARMIHGTRVAMLVGVVAMSIASIIGIFFGAFAGFFGDDRLQVSRLMLWFNIAGFVLGVFFAFVSRQYALSEGELEWELLKSIGVLLFTIAAANGLALMLQTFFPAFAKKITLPVDLVVMRLIEIMNSIPTLLLLLAIVATIKESSVFHVMVIIGLIRWTGIARFIRAELLRIRNMEYIEAARALGMKEWRILVRHAIPNALTPVLIAISFGIAGAILLEAFLSFLNIGTGTDATWGGMLTHARTYPKAWWLALFPGLAIFITVTIFNLIGEGLTDAMDPKQRGDQKN